MRVALAYTPSEQQFLPVPPLGITALSSYLKSVDISNDVFDLELELWLAQGCKSSDYAEKSIDKLIDMKLEFQHIVTKLLSYEIVCFSLMGKRQIPYMLELSKRLKEESVILKKIIIGGAFLNKSNSQRLLTDNKELIDYAIIGEGWAPLSKLIDCIKSGNEIKYIPGVAYLDNEVFNFTEEEFWDKELPVPEYSGINTAGYILQQKVLYELDDESIMYQLLVGDRNCPYSCSFCRISKNTKTVKQSNKIAEEMIYLNKTFGCNRFSLVCNEMNPTPKYLNDVINILSGYDKKIDWFCYLRPNKLDYDTLKAINDVGCNMVRYGVESGSQKILDHMNKKLYVEEMKQILCDSNKAGIWNHINIITGYLHEDQEDVENTLSFIEECSDYIDSVRINPFFIPIRSPIHEKPQEYGIDIISDEGSHIAFEEPGASWEKKQDQINHSTKLILNKCVELGLSFGGILPHLISTSISHFGNKLEAKRWLKMRHGYLWEPISPDTAKWRLAHPERTGIEINCWEEISGKRGSNYQTK